MPPPFTALLFTLAAQTSPVACTPDNLAACKSMNDLIWSPAFRQALRDFVGDGRASWLYADGEIIDQVIAALGGPDEKPVPFAPGLIRFSACRAHSCWERGTAVLTEEGQIKAIAVLHFACARRCSRDYKLVIFMDERNPSIEKELTDWANTVVDKRNRFYARSFRGDFRTRLAEVEIRLVAPPTADQP